MIGQPLPTGVCSSVFRALLLAHYVTMEEAIAELEARHDSDGSDSDGSDSSDSDEDDDVASSDASDVSD